MLRQIDRANFAVRGPGSLLIDHGRDFKLDGFTLVLICFALFRGISNIGPYARIYNIETGRWAFFHYHFQV